ncbi:MAG: OmpA family protein [Candidatus Binatia bacterium]
MKITVLRTAAVALLATLTSGCLATRGYVDERVGVLGEGLRGTQGDVARLQTAMANLHLERKLVLDMRDGPTFAFGSANLSSKAKGEIDRFFAEMQERQGDVPMNGSRVFVVAGHMDTVGDEDYNFDLGQKRAQKVAGYLVSQKEVEPFGLAVVSYGVSKPLAANDSATGRQRNRRVEILVYGERVSSE